MKAAFFFDTYLVKYKNDYLGMTLTYDFFEKRYLKYFKTIVVSTRVKSKYINDNIEGYKKVNGKNVIVKPIINYKNMLDYFIRRTQIKKEIKNIIANSDKVIIRMPSIIGIIAYNLCEMMNKDYIIEMVACPLDGYMNHANPLGKIVGPLLYLKNKKIIKKAKNVLYVTNVFLQKRYPTNNNSYSCSDVYISNIKKNVIKNRINRINNIKKEIILCTIGNVGMKYKGHKYVFKALKELNKNSVIKYKYYLYGNGNADKLKKLSKKYKVDEYVLFNGSIPHSEIFNKLEEIDIYVQPSLQEGLPRALIEAMSTACPCVGSNAGGIPELLEKDYIFNKKNVRELVSIIKNFDKKNMIEQAKINLKKSLKYDKNVLDKKRAKIYKSI